MRQSVLIAARSPKPNEGQVLDVSAGLPTPAQQFEPLVAAVESHVHALNSALRQHEPLQVALCAQALHAALVTAQTAARKASLPQHAFPPALHQRLTIAAARALACRDAVARTLAAQGRELNVLLPQVATGPAIYDAQGMRQTATTPVGTCA